MRTLATKIASTTAAVALLGLAPAAPALALAEAPARTLPASQVDDCLSGGKVWLVVQDSKETKLVDKCVDVAPTGEELLTKAGVTIGKDKSGQMICTMEGEPATCPASFDGNFWHYYTAEQGGQWTFSQVGANQSKPKPGTLEGWCYGKECTPALPAMASAGRAPAANDASTAPASTGSTDGASTGTTASESAGAGSASTGSPSTESTAGEDDKRNLMTPVLIAAVVGGLVAAYYMNKRKKA
ncbi:hypothetical protein ACTQ49_13525 [Luteococcus sp. Sow4_B9]|uniref:hypothetical protein n=1 Tax=Luteococcus sp. Sow4_B9 TaxID=3438792 RepID=UPI003F9497CB